jgi:hypothetical protein
MANGDVRLLDKDPVATSSPHHVDKTARRDFLVLHDERHLLARLVAVYERRSDDDGVVDIQGRRESIRDQFIISSEFSPSQSNR